jgi:hypothetical protein
MSGVRPGGGSAARLRLPQFGMTELAMTQAIPHWSPAKGDVRRLGIGRPWR